MKTTNILTCLLASTSLTLGSVEVAKAVNLSFTGTLSLDNEVQFQDFSISEPSLVTFKSVSYGGGTLADGTDVPDGGFSPVLSIFDSQDDLIRIGTESNSPRLNRDSTTGLRRDVLFSQRLDPGDYSLGVSVIDNLLIGGLGDNLSRGYRFDDEPNWSLPLCDTSPGPGGFCDFTGDARTGFWAVDVLNIDEPIPVPEQVGLWTAFMSLFSSLALISWKRHLDQSHKRNGPREGLSHSNAPVRKSVCLTGNPR